jgi:6-pyruvoyltetrahydropterin/6-carboxytetrahydropterin synthase
MKNIGYAIDFKEIKRVGVQWIEDYLDHGMILNPKDSVLIKTSLELESKMWIMTLNGTRYCNPTAENIAKEVFLAMQILFAGYPALTIWNIRLYETPNCFVDCTKDSISFSEESNFYKHNEQGISAYRVEKGILEYDDRKEVENV